MAIRPITPPVPGRALAPGRPPGGGGNLRRNPSRGPGAIRPVQPGSVRPSNPRVPPTTPFQPGAPPSPPLSPIAAGLGGLLLLGQALWSLLNQRPPESVEPPGPGDELTVSPGVNTSFSIIAEDFDDNSDNVFCDGTPVPGRGVTVGNPRVQFDFFAAKVAVGAGLVGNNRLRCGPGTNVAGEFAPLFVVTNAAGATGTVGARAINGTTYERSVNGTNAGGFRNLRLLQGGVETPWVNRSPSPLLPEVSPKLPEELSGDPAPVPAPAPERTLPQVAPAPAEAVPLPVPVPVPGGLPGGAPSRPPLVRPGPTVTPGRGTSTGQTAPQPITATGVRPQLPPAPGSTATGTTVMPGGQQLAPNGPRPTPQAMATELGKLEQKLELALAPDGPLSLLELLNKVIDQVENIEFLIDRLFPPEPYTFPDGAYQLQPICDRDTEGVLLPPLQAPWTGGEGELLELRRKLDALAQLIQHHKTLKQPTCGGRGNGPGSNVTVHFESD